MFGAFRDAEKENAGAVGWWACRGSDKYGPNGICAVVGSHFEDGRHHRRSSVDCVTAPSAALSGVVADDIGDNTFPAAARERNIIHQRFIIIQHHPTASLMADDNPIIKRGTRRSRTTIIRYGRNSNVDIKIADNNWKRNLGDVSSAGDGSTSVRTPPLYFISPDGGGEEKEPLSWRVVGQWL